MIEPEGRRGYSGSLLLPAVALVLLIAIIALVAMLCTGGGDSPDGATEITPTSEATTPTVVTGTQQESALVPYVTTTHQTEYAGPCADADATADVGKVCSTYRGERQGVHAFVLGLTFSEGIEWAFVAMQGGAWNVVGSTSITPESAAVPGIPWPLAIGAEVVVIGTGSCLNVRTEPGGSAVDCIAEATTIRIDAGPQESGGRLWWRVEGRDGWVAADYLRYPDSTTDPAPVPTSAPADEGTPEVTPAP